MGYIWSPGVYPRALESSPVALEPNFRGIEAHFRAIEPYTVATKAIHRALGPYCGVLDTILEYWRLALELLWSLILELQRLALEPKRLTLT
jgi:hypothetical protein